MADVFRRLSTGCVGSRPDRGARAPAVAVAVAPIGAHGRAPTTFPVRLRARWRYAESMWAARTCVLALTLAAATTAHAECPELYWCTLEDHRLPSRGVLYMQASAPFTMQWFGGRGSATLHDRDDGVIEVRYETHGGHRLSVSGRDGAFEATLDATWRAPRRAPRLVSLFPTAIGCCEPHSAFGFELDQPVAGLRAEWWWQGAMH